MASKRKPDLDLSEIETAQLEQRLRSNQLTNAGVEYLLKILTLVQA